MSNNDQILRAYATISSLRTNVPDAYEVEEVWVREFNDALGKIEEALGISLDEFKVARDSLYRSTATSNYETGEVSYREGLWCRREMLLYKIDSVLAYFTGLQSGQDRLIGFRRP